MKEDIIKEIALVDGVSAIVKAGIVTIKGTKGEVTRKLIHPRITFEVQDNKLILKSLKSTKREKTLIGAFESHINNMVQGVQEHFVYTVKICSGHFPMNVQMSNRELIVKNFLGESVPRKVTISEGAEVKVNGDQITITSPNKEAAGQTAAKIESLCRITNRDKRIFQDGLYIIDKAGKKL
jgi:large subunit ribosomal protein L6